jgi:hypothetical protein
MREETNPKNVRIWETEVAKSDTGSPRSGKIPFNSRPFEDVP